MGIQRFKTIGMQSDITESAIKPEYAFKNYNVRYTALNDNTTLSITNELGTKKLKLDKDIIVGKIIGDYAFSDYIIILTKYNDILNIYHIHIIDDTSNINDIIGKVTLIFSATSSYGISDNVDIIGIYENNKIQKLYWADGITPLKLLIIDQDDLLSNINKNYESLFTRPEYNGTVDILVNKSINSSSSFSSGTIQYACTMYKLYGSETNILAISPLYYISPDGRGASPDEKVGNIFDVCISLSDEDEAISKFDYVRVYSIQRTSINSKPIIRNVGDIKIFKTPSIIPNTLKYDSIDNINTIKDDYDNVIQYVTLKKMHIVDTGVEGVVISEEDLIEKQLLTTIPKTLASKQNVLFLGNIKNTTIVIPENIRNTIKNMSISTDSVSLYFRQKSLLPFKDDIYTINSDSYKDTHFKRGEFYRLGIQFRKNNGDLSEVVWIKDVKMDKQLGYSSFKNSYVKHLFSTSLPESLVTYCTDNNFIEAIPVIVYPSDKDRSCICQGLLNPCVFNTKDRKNNSPHIQPSWFLRPFGKEYSSKENTEPEDYYDEEDHSHIYNDGIVRGPISITNGHLKNIPFNIKKDLKCEIGLSSDYDTSNDNNIINDSGVFKIDQSYLTMFSPDIEFGSYVDNTELSDVSLKIVGVAECGNTNSVYKVSYKTGANKNSEGKSPLFINKESLLNNGILMRYDIDNLTSICPWYITRSLTGRGDVDGFTEYKFDKFKYSTLQFFYLTAYLSDTLDIPIESPIICRDGSYNVYRSSNNNYYSNINKVIKSTLGDSKVVNSVNMVYNSGAHVFLNLKKEGNVKHTLPKLNVIDMINGNAVYNINKTTNNVDPSIISYEGVEYSQDTYNFDSNAFLSPATIMFVGELYRKNVPNRFGGDSEQAILSNKWIQAGRGVRIKQDAKLYWEQGDTYLNRYEFINSYPNSKDQDNTVTNVGSFLCESTINLYGRYDKNKYKLDHTATMPDNFNKMNTVYSSYNNFFTYHTLDYSKVQLSNFPNMIIWSKNKVNGDPIDSWSSLNSINSLEVNGEYGGVNAIRLFNNSLLVFQNKSISTILYNENMQITTKEGSPIELANTGRVNGIRNIINTSGTSSYKYVSVSPNGVYYYDPLTKTFNVFNDKVIDLGLQCNMTSIISNSDDINSLIYDTLNKELHIVYPDKTLVFSEKMKGFTSYYSYDDLFDILLIGGTNFMIRNNTDNSIYNIYRQHMGNYSIIFDKFREFGTVIISNENPTIDKIFTNLEFRTTTDNIADDLLTFDTIKVWNDYQSGYSKLTFNKDSISNLRKKFRIWRADIPRELNSRDRIRNPWAYIELKRTNPINKRITLHDLAVIYY